MPSLSIMLLCRSDRSEFEQAIDALRTWGEVNVCADVAAAVHTMTNGGVMPDWIVLASAFPSEYSQEDLDILRQHAPLARFLGIQGSWCEGEMRTGSPWPGVVRAYWHQAVPRCHRELRRLVQGHTGAWTLPSTATEEERLLHLAAEPWPKQQGLVVLHTPCTELGRWISEACRMRGYAVAWQRSDVAIQITGALAGIVDVDDFSEASCAGLQRFVAALGSSPVIALASFPRVDDLRQARTCGVTHLLSKPLLLDDLFETLEQCDSDQSLPIY